MASSAGGAPSTEPLRNDRLRRPFPGTGSEILHVESAGPILANRKADIGLIHGAIDTDE
jgi:hypothetical protein